MQLKLLSIATITLGAAVAVASQLAAQNNPTHEVVLRSELKFQPLNPARGDASPQAGTLWGNIKKDVPSGVILKFADGFASPPHIHNITYRAVVISGAVHNDDPEAETMWMGPGSFWTQPAGESHITAGAKGAGAVAFLEILEGPYLVQPSDQAFDNGERPINVEASNVVWLAASDVSWVKAGEGSPTGKGPQMAFLWGSTAAQKMNGTFLRIPAGYDGQLRGNSSWLRAVLIEGQATHQKPGAADLKTLTPGSYFGGQRNAVHNISCTSSQECIIYIRTEGRYEIVVP